MRFLCSSLFSATPSRSSRALSICQNVETAAAATAAPKSSSAWDATPTHPRPALECPTAKNKQCGGQSMAWEFSTGEKSDFALIAAV